LIFKKRCNAVRVCFSSLHPFYLGARKMFLLQVKKIYILAANYLMLTD